MHEPDPTHPSTEQLRAFSLYQVDDGELEQIAMHLNGCRTCRALLDEHFAHHALLAQVRAAARPARGIQEDGTPRLQAARALLRVEALLQAHDEADGFLKETLSPGSASVEGLAVSECPGTRLGPYKLLEQLGAGGMGVVWLAEQTEPVRRQVALKLIRPGLGSKQILARFGAERQALALMDHPNIARVLDADTTETGQPYFVMELVQGEHLTAFCDQHRLTLRQRLGLFVPVCQAIQHAHQKGVIHRDIKPSNVLVALYDGMAVPKVIDFGIAKALEQPLTEQTLCTGIGQVVGTLEYMSPEQAQPKNSDIDTRSDVYALGVLLYELLTGTTPLTAQRLRDTSVLEALRLIREEEPPRPSARLSESGESLAGIAADRQTEPAQLRRLLRGELDWVVLKALDKDRARRYETPSALARDVERYLQDEPVQACPPSASYRMRKFVRRHRAALATATAILLLLLAGVAVSTWQAVRATEAEGVARRAEQTAAAREQSERQAREQAERDRDEKERARKEEALERKYAQAIAAFVKDDFLALTSVEGQLRFGHFGGSARAPLDRNATLRQLLDRAAVKLDRRHDLDPRTEAELRWMVGESYRGLGEAGLAIPFLQRSVALRMKWFEPGHQETLSAQNSLALAYRAAGKRDLALPLQEETLKLTKARLGADHPDTLACITNLAAGYRDAGKPGRALPLLEEALQGMKARLGPDHPDTLLYMNNLAVGYRDARKPDRALPLLEKALKGMIARLGPDHPDTLSCMINLATSYQQAGLPGRALPLLEGALKGLKATLGPDHPDTLLCMNNLANGYRDARRPDQALPLFEEALKGMKASLGPDHPNTLLCMSNLAAGYWDVGKQNQALPLLRQAAAGMEKIRFQHRFAAPIVSNLISGYERLKQFDRAEPWRCKWLAVVKQRSGADSVVYASELTFLGRNLLAQQKWAEAEPVLREALAVCQRKQSDAWTTFHGQSMLGAALLSQQKYAEAEPLLVRGYEGLEQHHPALRPAERRVVLAEALAWLVRLYRATGQEERAQAYSQQLDRLRKATP